MQNCILVTGGTGYIGSNFVLHWLANEADAVVNLDALTYTICAVLEEEHPGHDCRSLITFVPDRPGHGRRHAIDSAKIETELSWQPRESFQTGIRKTVRWYLEHTDWLRNVTSGADQRWIAVNYAARG